MFCQEFSIKTCSTRKNSNSKTHYLGFFQQGGLLCQLHSGGLVAGFYVREPGLQHFLHFQDDVNIPFTA